MLAGHAEARAQQPTPQALHLVRRESGGEIDVGGEARLQPGVDGVGSDQRVGDTDLVEQTRERGQRLRAQVQSPSARARS